MNNKKVTVVMGSKADQWISSELHFSYLLDALEKSNSFNINIDSWYSNLKWNSFFRRRIFYPLELREKIKGNIHLIDQSYSDAILNYPDPAIITVADTFFWKNRSNNPMRVYFRQRIARGLERARALISISKQTANELLNDFKITENKIYTIPFSINPIFFTTPVALPESIQNKITEEGFLLHVGSLDPRKGFQQFLKAYAMDKHLPPLIQVGGKNNERISRAIKELNLSNKITFLGQQSLEVIHGLYSQCSLFVFPSLYEGFGVSPLEARASGAKILTTNMPSVVEVLGEKPILSIDDNPEEWVEKINTILLAPKQKPLTENIKELVSWEQNAKKTLEVYKEVFNF